MSTTKRGMLRVAVAAAALGVAPAAFTQDSGQVMEEIVITGSLISGTPEDAAMPVDSISSEDLEQQGAPPPVEMLKGLSYMNGIVGESNAFTAGRGQAQHGTATVNLRGLGANRTLVLLNGKRLAVDDANRLPTNAIERVEVLKDGGAVTYGSDAIAGVVNYITKETQDGFQLDTDYRAIEDSDGDYNIGLSWGTSTTNSDFFASLNYYHRSELSLQDVDYARQPYAKNPEGGWGTGANPGAFRAIPQFYEVVSTGQQDLFGWDGFIDPACEDYGVVTDEDGVQVGPTSSDAASCRTRYTDWYNLVDEQDTYQAFTSYDLSLGDSTDLHLEALYASTEVDHASSAASYTTANYVPNALNPAAAFAGDGNMTPFYSISPANPYLQEFAAANGIDLSAPPTVQLDNNGDPVGTSPSSFPDGMAFIQLNQWRPYFAGGNPAFGHDGAWTNYDREQYRLSGELTGMLGDNIGYRSSLTYSKAEDERQEWDIRIDKLQQALNGQGGESGDLWLNPFATAYPGEGASQAELTEQRAVAQWLMEQHTANDEEELLEFNFVLDGELPMELDGGYIGWAAGMQYRHEEESIGYWDGSNQSLHPCPVYNDTNCSEDLQGASPWLFLATYDPYEVDREVKAVFGEMIIPVTDDFTAQIAARYEDYGDVGGDSFDPNLRLRWQANDWLALRASAGTTFRVAGQGSLRPAVGTGFQPVKGNSTPVRTAGNPNLEPEEATNYNIGVMFSGVNYDLTIDYWRYDLDKRLTTEPVTGMVEALWPQGGTPDCTLPAEFIDRFDFDTDCESATAISGVDVNTINAGGIENDGIDIQGSYTWDEAGPGALTLGGSATWINKFETEAVVVEGVQVESGIDAVGQFNSGTTLVPLPELQGNMFLNYGMDAQNIRWTMNYVDSYEDTRDIFGWAGEGQTIDSHLTHNITYRLDVNANVTVSAVVDNVTDEEPPFARAEMNYDPVTHNPLTRTFKVGAKVRF